jgi:hypothetical protein
MTEEKNVRPMWSEEELDQALATLRSEVPPGEKALAKARAELISAAGNPQQPVTKRHWGRWVAATVTVAAVVAAALVLQTVSFGDKPPASSAAAQMLNVAADKIGAVDPVVRPGQYLYIAQRGWGMTSIGDKPIAFLEEQVGEKWVPADRSAEWLMLSRTTGNRQWILGTEADYPGLNIREDKNRVEQRVKCGTFYLDPGERPCERPGSWQNPTQEFLASLPSDPKQLYDRLRSDAGNRGIHPDTQVLVLATDALGTGVLPAKVRANLYRALAFLPGLAITDQEATLDGRRGIGFGLSRAGERDEIVIDPATGQCIGGRRVLTKAKYDLPAGTVISYSSTSTAVVDKMGDKPAS